MAFGIILVACYIVLACAAPVIAALVGNSGGSFLYEAGKNTALTGFTILILQSILAARYKFLTRPFGLDIVIRFHRLIALFAGLLIFAHPILLYAGTSGGKTATSLGTSWYIWLGPVVLFALIINLVVSSRRKLFGLTFERWRSFHGVIGIVIFTGAFLHSWFAGSDLKQPSLQVIWIVLITAGLAVFLHHRFIRPIIIEKHPYTVTNVKPEAEKVWTIELEPSKGQEIFDYLPGQFHFITLHRSRDLPEEEHHFTISSSPENKKVIASTIKEIGDFTSTIGQTKAGDKVSVQGAFGRFSYCLHPEETDLVFIAGGIGITPIMSMLRCMRDRSEDYKVTLLYGNRTEPSIAFKNELDEMQAGDNPSLNVVHVLSKADEQWTGEKGYITREILERYAGTDISGKTFYICGPVPMRKKTVANLKNMGVKDNKIRTEIFSLVD